jgi:hypothetical protein
MQKYLHPMFIGLCVILLNCNIFSSCCCKMPERGLPGPTGPIGPAGPASLGTFVSLSTFNSQVVGAGNPVIFEQQNALQGNISYDLAGVITLDKPGYYSVKYGLSANANNRQFVLRLNGLDVNGSPIDSQSSIMQGISVIFQTTLPMSTLQLINNSGSSTTLTSSTPSSESSYIVIQQIQ